LRYRFKLKHNITWHDGHPFTADDVKFTFDRILDPKTNTVRRSNFIINGTPMTFTVIDPLTIDIQLPEPFAPALTAFSTAIIPQHLLQNIDINTAAFNRNPIGTGPFIFVSYESGQYVKLTQNPNYYGTPPRLKDIWYRIIPDGNTAVLSFENGELDAASIPPKEKPRFTDNDQLTIHTYTPLSYTYIGFNLKHPIFKHQIIRKAIAHAIDKPALVRGVLKQEGQVAHIPASPALWSYPKSETFSTYAYDPEMSMQLLESEGYEKNQNGIFEKNGNPLSFVLLTNKGNKEREKAAKIIQQFLRQVGIDMSIQIMEWSSFLKVVNSTEDPKPFDAVILGWSLGIDPDGYAIWHSSQYPNGFNFIGYNNPRVDQLLVDARRELVTTKRAGLYHQLYQHIAADLPYIFLFFPKANIGIYHYVQGLSQPGPAGLFNPFEQVYIATD
jgi:peptide/nickel transport system substrate-binding protein